MKKIISAIAALAMVAGLVSCQKENATENGSTGELVNVKLTAGLTDSKVSYSETDNVLTPAWEMNDNVTAICSDNSAHTLTVTSLVGDRAILEGTAVEGTAYLVCGVNASWNDSKMEFSYDEQSGDEDMPAVMFAKGYITAAGGGEFTFRNAGAVLAIYNAKGVPAESAISKVTLSGSNLSAATVSINGDALVLTATEKAADAISTETLSDITVATGETATLSKEILIAVPAGAKVEKVTLTVGEDTYSYTLSAAKTCNANDYLFVKSSEFKKDVVLPKGALPGLFSVSATKKVNFSQGNLWYGKVGSASAATFQFEAEQYEYHTYDSTNNTWGLFGWVGASSQAFTSSPEIYGVSISQTIDDYGNVSDEALKADWGKAIDNNDTWRTLFSSEWNYLFKNRTDAVSKFGFATVGGSKGIIILPDTFTDPMKNNGSAAFAPKSTTTGWTANVYETGGNWEAMEAAGAVFLPAASRRQGSSLSNTGGYGYYWSSTSLYSQQKPNIAYFMNFYSSGISPENYGSRDEGYSVRLVTDAN